MSQMGKQGGMTKDSKAKMMPESSSPAPQGSSSDMGAKKNMESNKSSGQKMGEDMKKGMEGMGKKMGDMKEGMKEGMGMGQQGNRK